MPVNLLELSKDTISPEIISKISVYTGESPDKIQSAVNTTLPAIVGSLANKVIKDKGASEVMKLIRDGGFDGNMIKNAVNSFSTQEKFNGVLNNASHTVNSIFGSKIRALTNLISKDSGISTSSASSLLGILSAVVMSFVGKQLLADNLNAKSLAEFLYGQRSYITGLIPVGIAGILGLNNLNKTSILPDQFSPNTEDINFSGQGKFKPWLLIAICAALLFILWRSCGIDKPPAPKKSEKDKTDSVKYPNPVYTVPPVTGDPLMDSLTGTIGKFITKVLPDGTSIIIAENGVEAMLIDFIEDENKTADKETWYSFDRILFETNSSTLRPSSEYGVKNIVSIMKAYPNVEIKIGGYTDNTGDPKTNLKLSQERADAVMNALIKNGVEKEKIRAEGYGDKFPVASNDTPEGRNRNRRVDVRISKK